MPAERTPRCQLYLISPLEVGGDFPARLERALEAGPVAAFQFRRAKTSTSTKLHASPRRCRRSAAHATWRSSSTTRSRWPSASGPTACISASTTDRCARRATTLGRRGAGRRDLPRQPPPGDGSRRSRGRLRRVRGLLPEHDQGQRAPARARAAELVAEPDGDPCVAIGGITPENCAPLVEAGADFLAVSGAVWGGDEAEAVRRFAKRAEIGSLSRGTAVCFSKKESPCRMPRIPPSLPFATAPILLAACGLNGTDPDTEETPTATTAAAAPARAGLRHVRGGRHRR